MTSHVHGDVQSMRQRQITAIASTIPCSYKTVTVVMRRSYRVLRVGIQKLLCSPAVLFTPQPASGPGDQCLGIHWLDQ